MAKTPSNAGPPYEAAGLLVWPSKSGNGYWNPDREDIGSLPEGWELLPPGDASVTRRVKKGPHWILMEKKGKAYGFRSIRLGILAPKTAIDEAREALGGIKGAEQREQRKQATQEKREHQLDVAFAESVRRNYPGLPSADIPEVVARARSAGRVGRSADWYFAPGEKREEILAELVGLAMRAHARHKYTDYDNQLSYFPADETEDGGDVDECDYLRGPLDEDTYLDIKRDANEKAEPIVEGWRHPPAEEPHE